MTLKEYHRQSRELSLSLFFMAPILAVYEIGIFFQDSQIRNGADILVKNLFSLLGQRGLVILNLALLASFLIATLNLLHKNRPVFILFLPMTVESLLYALILAPVVLFISERLGLFLLLAPTDRAESFLLKLVLSMGAGVYEEIVFRLGLLSFFFAMFHRWLKLQGSTAGILAVLIASLLFSGFHHIGALGEPFSYPAFFFRFLCGVVLSAVFMIRGLGIAVATHALYNILIFARQALEA